MNRYIHFFWLVLLTACSAKQQPLRITPNRLLFHSTEMAQAASADSIKWIRPILFQRKVVKVRYPDNRDAVIARDSIWGYSDRRGRVYRRYRKTFLEVVQVGELIKYEEQTTTAYPVNGQVMGATVTNTYYSRNLDSQIFSSPKKALRDSGAVYQ